MITDTTNYSIILKYKYAATSRSKIFIPPNLHLRIHMSVDIHVKHRLIFNNLKVYLYS